MLLRTHPSPEIDGQLIQQENALSVLLGYVPGRHLSEAGIVESEEGRRALWMSVLCPGYRYSSRVVKYTSLQVPPGEQRPQFSAMLDSRPAIRKALGIGLRY